MEIVKAVLLQDADTWRSCFCGCGCIKAQKDHYTQEMVEATQKTLFCSETAALILQEGGWLSKAKLADRFLPKDFADGHNSMFVQNPNLLTECCLEAPIQVLLEREEVLGGPPPGTAGTSTDPDDQEDDNTYECEHGCGFEQASESAVARHETICKKKRKKVTTKADFMIAEAEAKAERAQKKQDLELEGNPISGGDMGDASSRPYPRSPSGASRSSRSGSINAVTVI